VLLNVFVIRLTLQRSVLSLLSLSPLGWTMQTLSCTASPQVAYISRLQRSQNTLARVVAGNRTPGSHLATLSKLYTGCRCQFTIVLNSKLLQWPIKLYILVNNPHIWLIWFSGTRHAELYGLFLPTFCLLLVVTFHLVLEVLARQLLLSWIVSPLTSVPANLSQHSAVI